MHSNLFGRLEKIEVVLEKKYLEERQGLEDGLKEEKERLGVAQEELRKLREYRD